MTLHSIGDLARGLVSQRHFSHLRDRLDSLSYSLASGRHAELARETRGDLLPLAGIEASITRNTTLLAEVRQRGFRLEAQQAAIQSIHQSAQETATRLLGAYSGQSAIGLSTAGHDAVQAFGAMVDALNSRMGETYLFSGDQTDRPALRPAPQILAQIADLTAAASSVEQAETIVANWFTDTSGFSAFAYQGGAQRDFGLTGRDVLADDPALRQMFSGMALAALVSLRPDLPQSMQAGLAKRSGEILLSSATGTTGIAARIGLAQEQATRFQTRLEVEGMTLERARSGIVASDPHEIAIGLRETQTQMEAMYTITARLSRLSLTEYLR
jgi:flagellar hook-associated protein 3 FlgL